MLAAASVLSWGAIWGLVREPARAGTAAGGGRRPSALASLRELLRLFALPQTAGLVAYAAVGYAGFISLRGLWLGPLLVERHGFSLVQSGNVALAREDLEPGHAAQPFLEQIYKAGQRARSLVQQILAFSRQRLAASRSFLLHKLEQLGQPRRQRLRASSAQACLCPLHRGE